MPHKAQVQAKYENCLEETSSSCAAARGACTTLHGGSSYIGQPTIVRTRVAGGQWQYAGTSCNPSQVNLPDNVDAPPPPPPIPTMADIQEAFEELPFSKPRIRSEPPGGKSLINFTTFYWADWPDNSGLKAGEISKPVQLLSWSVEFKVDEHSYNFDFGDGSSSGWTSSSGGRYPDGQITHVYKDTGHVDIKVDAKLTGQYRVNGGEWRDLDAVADLQDEPVAELEIRGTRTRLTAPDDTIY